MQDPSRHLKLNGGVQAVQRIICQFCKIAIQIELRHIMGFNQVSILYKTCLKLQQRYAT